MKVEVMDTTLRDGEQTSGVSFNPREKLQLARLLLDELNIDRIEVGSAHVSAGELQAVRKIVGWASQENVLEKVEVLGFVDGKSSVDWICGAGAKVINLLCKGSLKHVTAQLNKTPEQHIEDIKKVINYANKSGLLVNIYLEDWSNGIQESIDYVFQFMDALQNEKIVRFMIADTLGILNHEQAHLYCSEMIERYPELHFDFHAHNDYDLAAANVYSALKAGVKGIHTTVNGLGERAGNVPLSSVIGIVNDHLGMMTTVNEAVLSKISTMVETFSGIRIPSNKPIIGENVFTQTCGVHADGDSKANLYFNNLEPERFGRTRQYALGKTSGKANIKKNLQAVGLSLDEESLKKVTKRIIELGDRKEYVTKEDLPYIVSDVLNNGEMSSPIVIKNYSLSLAKGLRPVANISIEINNKSFEESAIGDGQYDAFMKALWKIYASLNREHPVLVDYVVNIPPGGKTDALVDTMITWSFRGRVFKTRAVEADQTEAAIKATQKMLNIIENYYTEDEIKNS